jgi:single-stranded DNA-specific DHH superfamily exonuclease
MAGQPMRANEAVDKLIERFSRLVEQSVAALKVQIFHHNDADGVCAAVSAATIVRHFHPDKPLRANWVGTHQFDFTPISRFLAENQDALVLCFDLNFSSKRGFLSALAEEHKNRIIVVDDHVPAEAEPLAEGFLLNPNFRGDEPVEFPPSLFAYLAARRAGALAPTWLPQLGLQADKQLEKYKYLFDWSPPNAEIHQAIVELTSIYLLPGIPNEENLPFDFLSRSDIFESDWSNFYSSVMTSRPFEAARKKIVANVDAAVALAERPENVRTLHGRYEIVLYQQQDLYRTTNIIASRISAQHAKSIVFAYRADADTCFFEIRVGKLIRNYDIVDTLNRVAGAVSLRNFGGHPRAAGGACAAKDIQQVVAEYVRFDRASRLAG